MISEENRLAFFLDIDGTLTTDSFNVPEENIKAISQAREMGHKVFINTGRSWGNIPQKLFEQLDVDGFVCGNGAMITVDGVEHRRERMADGLIMNLADYFLASDEYWCVFEGYNGNYIISNGLREPNSYQSVVNSIEDVEIFCKNDEIQLFAMGPVPKADFVEKYSDELDFFPINTYADCVKKGFNKANGIEKVIEITGIKKENTVAIGDSANDLAMLEFSGVGVAMGNAPDDVKQKADIVTGTNREFGVAKAILELINKEERK